jgi:hypothetical protein
MNEKDFQQQVISIARMYGWKVQHTRAVQMANGRWATPIQGEAGFPDLVLVKSNHDGRGGVIFAELKTDLGRVGKEQHRWIDALEAAGAEWYVWRPTDLLAISHRLSALSSNVTVTQ